MERPVAVVTGASSGFGEQIVRNLATEGWLTIGVARRADRLMTLAGEVDGEYKVCDVSDQDYVEETATAILDEHPKINLLVNNAGEAMRDRFIEAGDCIDTEDVMKTNYLGSVWMAHALLGGLMDAAPSADIVNMVSAAATVTNPHSGPYGASKSAQLAFSRSLAADLRPHGVRVHSILPGKANTEGHPQKVSNSFFSMSKIIGTDVETVADAVVERIGKKSSEIYVPKVLRAVAVLNTAIPVTAGRAVNWLLS